MEELETPCLVVDLDALEHNYQQVADLYGNASCKMRQHAKNLKTPILARMQMAAGGTVGGVCTAKVSEAEVMVEGGIDDVLVTSQVVTGDKLSRAAALARHARITLAVDDPRNLHDISAAAQQHGVTLGVLIEVNTSMGRAGVRHPEQAVGLARLASDLPGVAFRGIMSHQTLPGRPDREARHTEGRRFLQQCLGVKAAIEAAGIPVETVSTGETWTYDVAPSLPEITEVQGGTYALMSHSYSYVEDFHIALYVLGMVISTPRRGLAIGDVGLRALPAPGGLLPVVDGVPGVHVAAMQETRCVLQATGEMPLNAGDTFLLTPGQQDFLVNRWDQLVALRDGKVEAVWEIAARGCHH